MNEIKNNQYLDTDFYEEVKSVLLEARKRVYKNNQNDMVLAYWQIGKMIVEKQGGKKRAAYSDGLIKELPIQMTKDFGRGFDESNLRNIRQFYIVFKKRDTVCRELSWSHYKSLMKVEDADIRDHLMIEAVEGSWSVSKLSQEISIYRDVKRVNETPSTKLSKKLPF